MDLQMSLAREGKALPHASPEARALPRGAAYRDLAFGSNPALVDEVASGRAALGYHVLGSYALRAVRANPVLAIAASNAPLLAISRLALISSRAPHPNAARLFVDYLLSQEGQRHLLKAGLFPIRSEAGDGSRTTALAPIRIDSDFDYLLDPLRRRALLSRWQAAVAGPVMKPKRLPSNGRTR